MVYLNNCPLSRAVMQQGWEVVKLDQMEHAWKNQFPCTARWLERNGVKEDTENNLSKTVELWWIFNAFLLHISPFFWGGGVMLYKWTHRFMHRCLFQGCFFLKKGCLTQSDLIFLLLPFLFCLTFGRMDAWTSAMQSRQGVCELMTGLGKCPQGWYCLTHKWAKC